MDLENILSDANPDLIIFLLTALIAFISWLVKSLVEKPITESKNTFNKFLERRVEILTEVKTRLNFIAYFPVGEESLAYKNQLQEIILKDGKTGYLDKYIYDSILKIAIDPKTDEKLLLETIGNIDRDLYLQITKVQDEISFYRKFSNYQPIKRFAGFTVLALQYIISFLIIFFVLFLTINTFLSINNYYRLILVLIAALSLYIIDKWLTK